MRTQRQGVRFTKTHGPTKAQTPDDAQPTEEPIQTPIIKKKDIFTAIYSPINTMYTYQTGKFPHSSSLGSNSQIIIHEIDGASTWVELMKYRIEGVMIEAQRRGLKRMKQQGITLAHQVLVNKIS